MTALRVAIAGPAGDERAALAKALADRLGLPVVAEAAGALRGSAAAQVAAWRRLRDAERTAEAFVADGSSLDLAASALQEPCVGAAGEIEELIRAASAHARSYDAVLALPGSEGRSRQGPDDALADMRYRLVLDGLGCAHGIRARVHHLPVEIRTAQVKLDWALEIVARTRPRSARGGGCVYLVGAGPGDPGLLTVRALELLRAAEVVAHDELVPAALLDLAAPGAELLAVGRRCHGRREPLRLHPAVLDRALSGKQVVRLKAGDPFVFGRGGEEAEELASAGVPFEVVPGISAALGAAAAALIPLTHRQISSDVTFATGHDLTSASPSGRSDWARLAPSGTVVLYMASCSLAANLERLVRHGRSSSTPAAWISGATRPEQEVVTGTLADLAVRVGDRTKGVAPALVVVGEVVAVREKLLALSARAIGARAAG